MLILDRVGHGDRRAVKDVDTSVLPQPMGVYVLVQSMSCLPRELREESLRQTLASLAIRACFRRAGPFFARDAMCDQARHGRAARMVRTQNLTQEDPERDERGIDPRVVVPRPSLMSPPAPLMAAVETVVLPAPPKVTSLPAAVTTPPVRFRVPLASELIRAPPVPMVIAPAKLEVVVATLRKAPPLEMPVPVISSARAAIHRKLCYPLRSHRPK